MSFIDWVLPPLCIRCQKRGAFLCPNCLHTLFWLENTTLSLPHHRGFFQISSACAFTDTAQLLVHAVKYEHFWAYVETIAQLTCIGVGSSFPREVDALVPIPLHPRRQRWRGYNQAEFLAKELAKRWQIPVLSLLKRPHFKPPQAKKGREERLHLGSVFALEAGATEIDPEKKLRLCLVDDVVTTGSTLLSASCILEDQGWKHVRAVTFAQTE